MSKSNRATQEKRNRERAKKERNQEKIADREFRKAQKRERTENLADGVDPDLVGIVPGPQVY